VRLFAKLPEPGIALTANDATSDDGLARERSAYTEWANRVLFDQLDITQVIFINKDGKVSFSLDRDRETGTLKAEDHQPDLPGMEFLSAGLKLAPGAVLTSPIRFHMEAGVNDLSRFMTLSFISPVLAPSARDGAPELQGVVIFNLDVGGLAHVYNGIYWVQSNGETVSISLTEETKHPPRRPSWIFRALRNCLRRANWTCGNRLTSRFSGSPSSLPRAPARYG
jgi:hypothetical protein